MAGTAGLPHVIVRFFTLWFAVLVGFIALKIIDLVKN